MRSKENELLAYACERFESGKYEEALEAFVLAYQKGYEREWILENIYNCYMSGNEQEFQKVYRQYSTERKPAYEDCTLDFIPYREGEYYIFDKKDGIFCGVFSIHAFRQAKPDKAFEEIEYSGAALGINWDWREETAILTEALVRKIYMVCQDAERCFSFCKIPELADYLNNIEIFCGYEELQGYFHNNTGIYLPMAIYGSEEERRELIRIRTEEHQYRLTPQGRNKSNVLLTIAVPTANRGNLLLEHIENLLPMPYDAEIEIAISKNCDKLYEKEYEQVGRLKDRRITYYDHGKDIGFLRNWHYAVEMSSGKYVMLISDEDEIIIDALEHYLKLLSAHPDLSVIRPRSVDLYDHITERQYGKRGWDAFDIVFLTQNHFPGVIFKKEDFLEADLLSLERYHDNLYYRYYPHEWWCLALSQRGDCVLEPVTLNDDSHPVDYQEEWKALNRKPDFVPGWKPYRARIGQFKGMVEFLQSVIKVRDKEEFERYFFRAMDKTTMLLEITRSTGYDPENYIKMVDEFAAISNEVIDNAVLDEIQKARQKNNLKNLCTELYTYEFEVEYD
ncbi:MAG: glycosyltransferase [Roseburia sp.]|nr:glycosyltransferase [Roseburia sp.]